MITDPPASSICLNVSTPNGSIAFRVADCSSNIVIFLRIFPTRQRSDGMQTAASHEF